MLKTRIIPVLLLKGNSVVKTVRFQKPRIVGDAVATVKVFATRKADEMIILDIDATKRGSINVDLIKRIAKSCNMPLSIGGGIKSIEDAEELFSIGADKIVINSLFYSDKNIMKKISEKFGKQAVVFSLDAKEVDGKMQAVANNANLKTNVSVVDAANEAVINGAGEIYLNSVDRDGCMEGYDLKLLKEISSSVTVPVIISGGCGDKKHCVAAIKTGANAVAAASIFFWIGESVVTIKEEMKKHGIEVRLK
jgi:imidazole glycerol-phosphate synthase subunit HisF